MSYTVLELARLALAVYSDPLPELNGWIPRQNFGSTAKHGFYAGLYQGAGDEKTFVLAYRGTDDWQVDLADDGAILLGWISGQMARARQTFNTCRRLVDRAPHRKLCLTGHSLGGGLAALVAAQYNVPCVTFNAPGTKRSLTSHYVKHVSGGPYFAPMIKITEPHEVMDGRILNIRARFDLVSVGTGPSLGVTDSINVKCEGPDGKPVGGPVQAGVAGFVDSIIHPKTDFVSAPGFLKGVAGYVLCQHQMTRMVTEVAGFDKYKRDLGW